MTANDALTLAERRTEYVARKMAAIWPPNRLTKPSCSPQTWIEEQRGAAHPKMEDWECILENHSGDIFFHRAPDRGALLAAYATPCTRPGPIPDGATLDEHQLALFTILCAGCAGSSDATLYSAYRFSILRVEVRGETVLSSVTRRHDARGEPREQGVVIEPFRGDLHVQLRAECEVLLAEWHEHRPRWEAARMHLCDMLAAFVDDVRTTAGRRFDAAPAVSEQFHEPRNASWIVVRQGQRPGRFWGIRETLRIYPATAFTEQKLIIPEDIPVVYQHPENPQFPESIPELVLQTHRKRSMRGSRRARDLPVYHLLALVPITIASEPVSILVVRHRPYLPEVLPEGGIDFEA